MASLIRSENAETVASDLRRLLGAEQVRDDPPSLTAYAVDASIYRIVPQAVVLARNEDDIEATIQYAVRHAVPLTPRAAGTNLTGSAIGPGIILDISRMNRILELNQEERWARVQPGIVLAELNKRLAATGLMFGPDPSSGEMCRLGGMVANNSAGPHTLRYGSVKDNVEALRVCLQDGWLSAQAYPLGSRVLVDLLARNPALSQVLDLVKMQTALIVRKRPTVSKNSCGYNLFGLVDGLEQGLYDLPKLFVGSEGTLGVVSEATLRLVDRPKASATALLHFRYLEEVGDAVPALVTLAPSALEIMDANTLDLIGRQQHGIPSDAAATLLVELEESPEQAGSMGAGTLSEQAARLSSLARQYRLCGDPVIAFEREQRDQLWKARKALYPTLYRYDTHKKPINFVDDVVVSAGRLSELIRYLEKFFGRQEVPVAIFGHIGNGNAHIVPLLNVNDPEDFNRMTTAYEEIHQTVLAQFGGSICGEHGDGRVRAEFVRRMFGEELYELFVRVKRILDPAGVLNPGVKISATRFTEHIDYTRLSKACATCGKCNAVCPVHDVFQSEDMSSRGWFEIVTAQNYSYLDSKRVVEACLNCKSCRTVCPAGVDVSDLILRRRAEHPNRLAGLVFAVQARPWLFQRLLKAAAMTQSLWDRPMVRAWLERLTGPVLRRLAPTARLPRDLVLPRLAVHQLRDRYPELVAGRSAVDKPRVAYFHGCAANYFDDGVGDAVIALLRRQGIEPALPAQRCSGTPIETYGHVQRAKDCARFNLQALEPYETIVTGCASCTLMLKDYVKYFADEPDRTAAERLANRVRHISQVVTLPPTKPDGSGSTQKVTYHSSCHLRAAGITKEPRELLRRLPGMEFVEMQDADRCAGGAGTYIIKDHETARRIFVRKREAVEASGAQVVATSCPACMVQLKNELRDRAEVRHIAELLDDATRDAVDRARSEG